MKQTILLIDDCEMMQLFLLPILEKSHAVVALNNPLEAILWLKTNPTPDAVILDFQLPEMNGLEFLQFLRQKEDFTKVPVIMLSGVKDSEKRWQCLEAGANDFLTKPFHPRELALRVSRITSEMSKA